MKIIDNPLGIFAVLLTFYSLIHQEQGWNQNSRLDVLHSLAAQSSFAIDRYEENTGDKAFYHGHFYSDKLPGIVLLALPGFAISFAVVGAFDIPHDSERGWLATSWITTALSVGIVTAAGGAALFSLLSAFVGTSYARITTFGVFLGAAPFPYATMLFSHAAVIGLLCISIWALSRFDGRWISPLVAVTESSNPCVDRYTGWLVPLAGICCGLAILSDFTSVIAVMAICFVGVTKDVRALVVFLVSLCGPLLIGGLYNKVCFDRTLIFSYSYVIRPEFRSGGVYGFSCPRIHNIWLLLFSPERGLLFWTPFFISAAWGFRDLLVSRRLFFATIAVPVTQVLLISAHFLPSGGSALGPRHLAPIIPFLAIVSAFGVSRRPMLTWAYAVSSVALTGIATVISALPPFNAVRFYSTRIADEVFAHNLLTMFGVPPKWAAIIVALLLLMVIVSCAPPLIKSDDRVKLDLLRAQELPD